MSKIIKADIVLSDDVSEQLTLRFEEARKEYPNLTLEKFIAWAIRYYLEHAYKDEELEDEC